MNHSIGPIRFPGTFYFVICRFIADENATVSDNPLFIDKGISNILRNIFNNGLPRGIIRTPLRKA